MNGLLLSDARWTEQMQKELRACWSRAIANDHRDTLRNSLKFVQEVDRFVTSRFFGEKKVAGGGSWKSLSWQHCEHLYYSPLSLSDSSSTRIFRSTHTYRNIWTTAWNIWTTANQREGPPFTISDWFRPRYGPNVCLLLNHRVTLRVTVKPSWTQSRLVKIQIFSSRTIEKLGRTCDL